MSDAAADKTSVLFRRWSSQSHRAPLSGPRAPMGASCCRVMQLCNGRSLQKMMWISWRFLAKFLCFFLFFWSTEYFPRGQTVLPFRSLRNTLYPFHPSFQMSPLAQRLPGSTSIKTQTLQARHLTVPTALHCTANHTRDMQHLSTTLSL